MTTREVNTGLPLATRRTLRQIAGSLGCTSSRGAYAGEGSITELLRGIADGRVVCVRAQDAAVILAALRAMRDNKPDEWDAVVTPGLCNVWDALKQAQPQGRGE